MIASRPRESDGGLASVDVSLRPSRLAAAAARDLDAALAPSPWSDPPLAVGDKPKGFVVATSKRGCFVRLARDVTARVLVKDLADGYVADPQAAFFPGRLVAGVVLAASPRGDDADDAPRIEMSLKASALTGELADGASARSRCASCASASSRAAT